MGFIPRDGMLKMKKIFGITLSLLLAAAAAEAENVYHRQKLIQDSAVQKQKDSDAQIRDELRKKMKKFISGINGKISDTGTKITDPVNPDDATDINDNDHRHSSEVIIPVYAFSSSDSLNLRSESNSSSTIVGKLKFAEKVMVTGKTDDTQTISGKTAPWLLVRKDDGSEGWAFGGFLQSTRPQKSGGDEESIGESQLLKIPVEGRISSRYGTRVHPVTKRKNSFHKGIDIAAPSGTPVSAAAQGLVVKAEYNRNGYGNLVVIQHANELATYYGHLSKILVKKGQRVSRSQLVGKVGATGVATGPHLHFEVRRGGNPVNPDEFIR